MGYYKVNFNLDGTGILLNDFEPIHLDALLCAIAAKNHPNFNNSLSREDKPDDILIPLHRSLINKRLVWHASALFCEETDIKETLRYWRKRFRDNRGHLTEGAPNLTRGTYRSYNMPIAPKLIKKLSAYFSGNLGQTEKLLKQIKGIGHKRKLGYGRVLSYEIEETSKDCSLICNGLAMRWLPDANGTKLVRSAPPYWSSFNKVRCCEIGDGK